MSTATPTDVRGVIDTDLTDSEIQNYLDDAEFENTRTNNVGSMTTEHVRQLEKHLAALYIVQSKDRSIASGSSESSRVEFDGSVVDWLRGKVKDLDPSGELALNVHRDRNRHITTTTDA